MADTSFESLKGLIDPYPRCPKCEKPHVSPTEKRSTRPEDVCSCLSDLEDGYEKCSKCGQQLSSYRDQPASKSHPAPGYGTSALLCESCKADKRPPHAVFTTQNEKKNRVYCPSCSATVLKSQWEAHQIKCTNGTMLSFLVRYEADRQEQKTINEEFKAELFKLRHEISSRDKQIEALTSQVENYKKENNELKTKLAPVSRILKKMITAQENDDFAKSDMIPQLNEFLNPREPCPIQTELSQITAQQHLPLDIPSSQNISVHGSRNMTNMNSIQNLPPTNAANNQSGHGSNQQSMMPGQHVLPTNAQNNQWFGNSPSSFPSIAPPTQQPVIDHPWGHGHACINGSVYVNAPNATFNLGNNSLQVNTHPYAQVGCGRSHMPATSEYQSNSLFSGRNFGPSNPDASRPSNHGMSGAGRGRAPVNHEMIGRSQSQAATNHVPLPTRTPNIGMNDHTNPDAGYPAEPVHYVDSPVTES